MNSVVKQPPKTIDHIRAQLNLPAMREQLQMALPPHVTLDKFLRVAVTALQQNPSLMQMERNSLFASIMSAAQLGLLPDVQLGECYMVPFKGKVTLIIGYRGLIKLARQGDIGFVEAEIICKNDKTLYVLGDNSHFESMVNWQDRGPAVAVYALAKYRDGGIAARVVMTRDQVENIRTRSQNANGPAWTENWEEMAKKTALRRLSKLLPLSTTAASAFRLSEVQEELGQSASIIEGQVVPEEGADAPPFPEPQETKSKRRRTALDEVVDRGAGPSVGTGLTEPDGPEGPLPPTDETSFGGPNGAPQDTGP